MSAGDAPEGLLAPTRIYAADVRTLLETCEVRAMAHVTGGGIPGNLPRALPDGLGARLDLDAWERPAVFGWLAANGVAEDELRRVFNIGIGYCAVIPAAAMRSAGILPRAPTPWVPYCRVPRLPGRRR